MIDKASFRNFRSLRDVQVDLEQFTVFVGPNASGKTSILEALDILCKAFNGKDVNSIVSGAMSRGSQDSVELVSEVAGHWYRYRTRSPNSQKRPPQSPLALWTGE